MNTDEQQEKPRLIALVDDDPDFLTLTQHVLEAAGYATVTATNPEAAMATLPEVQPDLLITDLMMTSLDSGFSVVKQVRAHPRLSGIPIIITTAVTRRLGFDFTPRTQEELDAMGVDAYIEKPIEPKAFLERVRELLDRGEEQ